MKIGLILPPQVNIFDRLMANSKKYFRVDEYIADLPLWMQEQLFVVREIILQSHPDIKEAIKFNIPFYSLNGLLFYISRYKNKEFVLGICNGANLPDSYQKLKADAKQKFIRHWTLIENQEPDYEIMAKYIESAIQLNLIHRAFSQVKKK